MRLPDCANRSGKTTAEGLGRYLEEAVGSIDITTIVSVGHRLNTNCAE